VKYRSSVFAALAALLIVVSACGSPNTPQPPPPGPGPGPIVEPPPPPPPPTWDPARVKIMAFGDSLTEDDEDPTLRFWGSHHDPSGPGGAKSYPFKLHQILTSIYTTTTFNVYNYGYGGEMAGDSATNARFNQALNTHPPQVLLLMHGTNDLLAGRAKSEIVAAVELMAEQAKARGVVVFLASLPPQSTIVKGKPNDAEAVPEYNDRLRIMAANRGLIFVDVYPYITPEMREPDGLHMLEAGTKRIAEVFYESLKAQYHRPPA
jgi:lysophospholipase L1-like esterase